MAAMRHEGSKENAMWRVLNESTTAIDLSQRSAVLELHGIESAEYLRFCDDETLDELSATLKPIPRRLFEYHRSKLSRPFLDTKISAHPQPTEILNNRVLNHNHGDNPKDTKEEDKVEHVQNKDSRESISNPRPLSPRLLLFLSDSRLARMECSEDAASRYLEIFEDDVESAVTAFLESDAVKQQQSHLVRAEVVADRVVVSGAHGGGSSGNSADSSSRINKHTAEITKLASLKERDRTIIIESVSERIKMLEKPTHATTPTPPRNSKHPQTPPSASADPALPDQTLDSAGDDGLAGYSVKQLKEAIAARGGSYASLLEKSDLREKLRQLIRDDQRQGVTRSSSISTTSTNSTSSSIRKSRNCESGASTGCSSGNDEQRKSEIFFQNTKKFFDVQEALDGLWRSNGKGLIEREPSLDVIEPREGQFDGSWRQMALSGEYVQDMSELYEAAGRAQPVFEQALREALAACGLSADIHLLLAPLKGQERAAEKARDDYSQRTPGPGVAWLFDIVRGSVVCDDEKQICAIVQCLTYHSTVSEGRSPIQVVRLKNRFAQPTPGGFRDVNMNISVEIRGDHRGGLGVIHHVCELQVHFRGIKELGKALHSHDLYGFFRTYFMGSVTSIEKRLAMMSRIMRCSSKDGGGGGGSSEGVCLTGSVGREYRGQSQELPEVTLQGLVSEVISAGDEERMQAMVDLMCLMTEFAYEEQLRRAMLRRLEGRLGLEHPDTLSAQLDLARVLQSKGDLSSARAMLQKTLDSEERLFGKDDQRTQSTLGQLALLLQSMGDLGGARMLYERMFGQGHQRSSHSHGHTDCHVDAGNLNGLNNYSGLLQRDGHLQQAKGVYERCLHAKMQHLGKDHPDTLSTMHNLACLLVKMGDDASALKLYEDALAGLERVLGPDHHNTIKTLAGYANSLMSLRDFAGACREYRKALARATSALGPEHPTTYAMMCGLALPVSLMRDSDEWRDLFERGLAGMSATSGPEHADTLAIKLNYCVAISDVEKAKARSLCQETLEAYERVMGPRHPQTMQARQLLQLIGI